MVAQLSEIFFPQPEECRSVEFRISPDVIVCVRVKQLTSMVSPNFLGLILAFHIYRARTPVRFLARDIISSLKQQDSLAQRSQGVSERPAASPGADDDEVELVFSNQV